MSGSNQLADRNLLVGILALQLDFIDRDQLIGAMSAWVLNKSTPLEQILIEQQLLSEEEQKLLAALTVKHLARHNSDPQRSLATVSSLATSVRDELGALGDPAVEASLFHVAQDRANDNSFESTVSYGGSDSQGLRYRILRPHAKGGLGEVFVANDKELNREVALKQIQPEQADNCDSRARFLLEAELTGGLEHPGIVPVYGLGQYDDGRPFYAMRFIRGDSLKDAVARFHKSDANQLSPSERSVSFRKLLGRLIDVCDAISYAHSRGVLHRDLKPGNVMLGRYGETLVVDWGLAKIVGRNESLSSSQAGEATLRASGSGSSPTQMGRAIGTPAYMSPEQAAGRIDLLGPASDVYSLGATLYSVLTGKPPLQDSDVGSALRRVKEGDFPAPREIAPDVPAPLEAICLKAMANGQQDRYPSPRALAEDLEHWLADESVSAYREPMLTRTARWARRHKVAVAAATGLVLTALVSVSVGAVLLAGANRNIRAAQELAETNERTANANFLLARSAVDDYLTTVSQETLLDEPGMQPLRRKLLTDALRYYEGFAKQRDNDQQISQELSDANFRVGTINSTFGASAEALAAFRRAMQIDEQLLQENPNDTDRQLRLARSQQAVGSQLEIAGNLDDALANFDRAIGLLQTASRKNTTNLGLLHRLQSLYVLKGSTLREQGQLEGIEGLFLNALEIGHQLVKSPDDVGLYRDSLAAANHNLALLYVDTGRLEDGLKHYRNAVDIREQLSRDLPRQQQFQSKLGLSYDNLANLKGRLGQHNEAIELHQQAIRIREQLSRNNPAVLDYRSELAISYGNQSSEFRRIGDLKKAADLADLAIVSWERLVEQSPAVISYRERLANSLYNIGNLYLREPFLETESPEHEVNMRLATAIEYYLRSIVIWESLVAEFPGVPDYRAALARAYNNCGSGYSLVNGEADAQVMNDKALVLREELVTDFPHVPDYRNELASTYSNLVASQSDENRKFELSEKSIALRQALVDDFPNVPEYRYKLAFSLQGDALHRFLDGQEAESLPSFRRAIPLLEQISAESPDVPKYRGMLVQSLTLCAAGERLNGEWETAVETEQRIVSFFEKLRAEDPENPEFIVGLVRGTIGVGKSFHKGKKYDQALVQYDRAVELMTLAIEDRPGDAAAKSFLKNALELRSEVFRVQQRFTEAIEDTTRLIGLTADPTALRLERARLNSLAGNHVAGVAEASDIVGGEPAVNGGQLYDAACVFAISVAAVDGDDALSPEDSERLIAEHTRRAFECLNKARNSGYFMTSKTIEHFSKDTDFDAVREMDAFVRFQQELGEGEPPK